jgi:hypothetical protein
MHTFSDSYTLGKFNPPSYANWLAELRTLFPVAKALKIGRASVYRALTEISNAS